MSVVGIIPARMASTRFPGKPMALIGGVPMIGHCYFRSRMSKLLDDVYVATCDQEIVDYIESVGGKAVMTADTHERASDRTAEAVQTIERETGQEIEIVPMIQGDEPMLVPDMIDEAVQPLLDDPDVVVVSLMGPLATDEEFEDPNEVKVVVDRNNDALYFSREPIPSRSKHSGEIPMMKQVAIIPFRKDFLIEFNELEPTPLEIVESVDLLRPMEHGIPVRMALTHYDTYAVDTPEDLARVEGLMKDDPLVEEYREAARP
jgi:3-deoxy-manno-octulosonate cytidylyltransferase (CMP-KDO synthetase)